MTELKIQTERRENGVVVVHLKGFLDAHTFEDLDEAIAALFEEGVYKVVADLSALDYISSAGAGVFIGALAEAQENGGNIILAAPLPNVREVFDLLGLSHILHMTGEVDTAVAAFRS
ncbi:MAG: STAS domain-containing protein [Planctomycetota bacterium]